MMLSAPVRPEFDWFASRLLRIESTSSLWLNLNSMKWLPVLPSGSTAGIEYVAIGNTPLLPVTLFFITDSLSMLRTVDAGLPNWSACRMRYGKIVPLPVLIEFTTKSPRLSRSPGEPPVQPANTAVAVSAASPATDHGDGRRDDAMGFLVMFEAPDRLAEGQKPWSAADLERGPLTLRGASCGSSRLCAHGVA